MTQISKVYYMLFLIIFIKKKNKLIDDLDNYHRSKNREKERTKLIDKAHRHTHLGKYRSKLVNDLNRYYHKQKSKNIKMRYTEIFKKETQNELFTN